MTETNDIWQARWLALARRWQNRLVNAGLGEIAQAMGQAFTPLAPFAAQILWFTQPGFALFGQSEAIHSLAELLDANDSSQSTVDSSQAKANDPGYKP
jgi:hypothetical protein